ncbi:nucleotide pyrophosphohydrolase [Candidatus Woesearchaeota archaeon]|nr:nucleotide pyrophosphohydrolase [Candidatus Woesearchaeota archaeon]
MTFSELQKEIDEWAQQFITPYWKPHEMIARLAEETGELAREINHRYGPKKKKPSEETKEIGEEICDIFMNLICLANSQSINLDQHWKNLMDKLYKRDSKRFERKDGGMQNGL